MDDEAIAGTLRKMGLQPISYMQLRKNHQSPGISVVLGLELLLEFPSQKVDLSEQATGCGSELSREVLMW